MSNPGNGTLPANWVWTASSDLFSFVTSGSRGWAKYYSDKGPIFLRIGNLHHASTSLDLRRIQRVNPPEGAEGTRTRVLPGDLLISITADLGMIALCPASLGEAYINQHIALARPRNLIDRSYLAWYLASEHGGQTQFRNLQRGATKAGLGLDDIKAVDVPLCPAREQHRIVSKIDELFSKLDAGVAALQRVQENLKRYRASVLKAAVEGRLTAEWRGENPSVEPADVLLERILQERRRKWEEEQIRKYEAKGKKPPKGWKDKYKEPVKPDTEGLPELPRGWCWASVQQVAVVQGGIQKQPKRAPRQNAFPYLRVANVLRNRLDLTEVLEIELFGDELDKLRLAKGDLLVVEGNGSPNEIGRSALWHGEIRDCVHQNHIIRVRFVAGSASYLNTYWNSPGGRGQLTKLAASTSGLYTLSVAKVSAVAVPIPPVAEQAAIAKAVDERLSITREVERQVEATCLRASRLRQSILKRAFEGRLVAQDPTDEPATVLLDRIREQREAENNGTSAKSKKTRKKPNRRTRKKNTADDAEFRQLEFPTTTRPARKTK